MKDRNDPSTPGRRDQEGSSARKSLSPKEVSKRPPTGAKMPVRRPAAGGAGADSRAAAARAAARRAAQTRSAARRPSARAAARQANVATRPLPPPPRRRPITARVAPPVAGPDQQLLAEVDRVQRAFAALEAEAQLSNVYTAVGNFDAQLVELPNALDELRDRGYVHSGKLDDQLEALDDRWDNVRPRVEQALTTQVRQLDTELDQVERLVDRLRPNQPAISAADSAVGRLKSRIGAARDAVEGLYEGMEEELNVVSYRIGAIKQMMQLLAESQEIRLQEAEGPLLAVSSVWRRDGESGPEGVLFLTDQRLMFEQREEIVTKKRLGIFKAESEQRRQVLLDVRVAEIDSVEHKEEGGFLGMGKDDILDLVLAATAPVSRASFHLKGAESEDWAIMIKRVQTGEIDEDRADEYVDEMQQAESMAAAFPSQCPNCFAAVPEPARGTTSITCEFCGTIIKPEVGS